MNVLLPVDGSPSSDAAVDTVIHQFDPKATVVRVIHVVEAPLTVAESLAFAEAAAAAGIVEGVIEEHRRQGRQITDRAAARLKAAGFSAVAEVFEGAARPDILAQAHRWCADVIVMGSHGRHGLSRLVMGSVAEHVLRHAACAVEIVRPPLEDVRKAS